MNHTPTPWQTTVYRGLDSILIQNDAKRQIGSLPLRSIKPAWEEEARANAEYIVHACNNYPALVAACQAVIEHFSYPEIRSITQFQTDSHRVFEQVHDALAAAGEGLDVDPEYEAMIADVGLHGENAEPQALSDPLPLLDGTTREEA